LHSKGDNHKLVGLRDNIEGPIKKQLHEIHHMFKEDLHSVGEIENKDTLDLLIPIEIFLNKLLSRIDEL